MNSKSKMAQVVVQSELKHEIGYLMFGCSCIRNPWEVALPKINAKNKFFTLTRVKQYFEKMASEEAIFTNLIKESIVDARNYEKENIGKDVEEPEGTVADDGNFRLDNRWLLLTYKTHIDKKKYEAWVRKKCPQTDEVYMAHENGDKTVKYEHTHVLLSAKIYKKFATKSCRFFDYEKKDEIHPHIKRLGCYKAFKDGMKYLAKEDREMQDLAFNDQISGGNIVEGIIHCENNAEALVKYCKTPAMASGVLAIRNAIDVRERKLKRVVIPDYPWQVSAIEFINSRSAAQMDRDIIWIFDEVGNTGKSCLAKHLKSEGKKWYSCTEVNQTRDLAAIAINAIESGWEEHGWIFDLSRSAQTHKGFYSGIECLKNGSITSTKYSGKTIDFDPPHVVVFANFPPIVSTMSKDRWQIWEIFQDKTWKKISTGEAESRSKAAIEKEDIFLTNMIAAPGTLDQHGFR